MSMVSIDGCESCPQRAYQQLYEYVPNGCIMIMVSVLSGLRVTHISEELVSAVSMSVPGSVGAISKVNTTSRIGRNCQTSRIRVLAERAA